MTSQKKLIEIELTEQEVFGNNLRPDERVGYDQDPDKPLTFNVTVDKTGNIRLMIGIVLFRELRKEDPLIPTTPYTRASLAITNKNGKE